MMQRRYMTTAVILCVGTAVSLCGYLLTHKLTFLLERATFEARADERVDSLAEELRQRLAAVQELSHQLGAQNEVSVERFRQLAQPLLDHPGIARVDWAPRVAAEDLWEFQQLLQEEYGEKTLLTKINNRGQRVPMKSAKNRFFPVRFAVPREYEKSIVGLERNVRIDAANKSDPPVLFTRRKFYPAEGFQAGVMKAVRRDSPEREVMGLLSVTLKENLFHVSHATAAEQPILVRITNVTNPPRAPVVASDFREEHVRREASKSEQDEVFFARTATIGGYTFRKVGGDTFRFDCRQNPLFNFRPGWLPFATFFSGLVVTAFCGCYWATRSTQQLELLNMKLRREIEERKDMQRALQDVLEFREQERELVAHDIHDGFVQQVVGAQMVVQGVSARLNGQHGTCGRDLEVAAALLAKAIDDGRRMITDLKPSVVDELGLVEAIRDFVSEEEEDCGLSITFRHSAGFRRLPLLVERTLFRVVQETLTNVKRHSGVGEATVSLSQSEHSVILEVRDRGRGFELSRIEDGRFGVRGIQERARLLHGHATISSVLDEGTCVTVEIPLTSPGIAVSPQPLRQLSAPPG